jgi:hypothetical protein
MKPTLVWSKPECPELPPDEAAAVKRGRGRPKKPTEKTPVCASEFDAIAAAIRTIPPDRAAAEGTPATPGRNAARDRARLDAAKDKRLSGAGLVVFNFLLDEIRWSEGRVCHSKGWIAKLCDLRPETVRKVLKSLGQAGKVIRRRQKNRAGDWAISETTLPPLALAWQAIEVGAGNSKEVGSGKSGGVGVNSPLGRVQLDPQPSVIIPLKKDNNECMNGASRPASAANDFQSKIEDRPEPKIEVLSHWKATEYFRWRKPPDGEPPEYVGLDEWRGWLDYYDGAPEHLATEAAHKQVMELTALLWGISHATGGHIVAALAYWICKAHRDGKRIGSLGFIAEKLVRQSEADDFTG